MRVSVSVVGSFEAAGKRGTLRVFCLFNLPRYASSLLWEVEVLHRQSLLTHRCPGQVKE